MYSPLLIYIIILGGVIIEEADLLAAAKLGLNIALEAINCLSRRLVNQLVS